MAVVVLLPLQLAPLAMMNTERPSYRKVRDFLDRLDGPVIPTDSTLAQQARNMFSKEDAFDFAREAFAGPSVVLVRPYSSQNIGSVARCMLNFGLTDLRVVRPARSDWLNRDALECAAGARGVLVNARVFDSVVDAVADVHAVYATTARFRDVNKDAPLLPDEVARRVAAAGAQDLRSALLFGSERNGLANDELAVAHDLVSIPSNMVFGSLNLSHAVMILAYECWLALLASRRNGPGAAPVAAAAAAPEPATPRETEALFSRLRKGLENTATPDRAASIVDKVRNMLLRARVTKAEVRLLHGVVRDALRADVPLESEAESTRGP